MGTASRLLVAGALVAACGRDRSGQPAPATRSFTAEAVEAAPPPAPELSRFDVPLDYDFSPVLSVVERAVPKRFGSLDSLRPIQGAVRKKYAFEATRGPFVATAVGSEVRLRTKLSYAARGFYKPQFGPTLSAGCGKGDARPEVVIELSTPLTLTPAWHLRSRAKLRRVAPASETPADRCRVSVIKVDVTDKVVEAARTAITAKLPEIDRQVGKVDLTNMATGWWALLNRPIRLADGVWLALQPTQLRLGRVTGTGHVLNVEAGLDAYPKIVTGDSVEPEARPLPPLGGRGDSSGFRILVEGNVDYATVSRAVTAALKGKTVTQAGHTVRVEQVTAAPAGGKLALTVQFSGDANGALTFVGTPRHDAAIGHIVVPDLDYDLDTDNALVNAVAWVKSDELRELFRSRARVPAAPALERGRTLLSKGLNRPVGKVMTLAATVDSVAVNGVYVTRPGLVVRASAVGTAKVSVRQQKGR